MSDPANPPAKVGKLYDKCAWCEKALRAHDRAWENLTSEEGLSLAGNYCKPLPGDLRDPDWHDANGVRNKGRLRSGCERLGMASPDIPARKLRARQAEIADA